ncbi:hypothetical protein GH714_033838 [Hevea brasiliensis]|uniref:Protein kinase domain-containing protein n=1 Tax=Hevea brasiliensis TaxID=3981 RepID=A0A6A6M3U2_HEVBR|nr:hypothetical protein GH714_033838 [Hevea brasiliensis]
MKLHSVLRQISHPKPPWIQHIRTSCTEKIATSSDVLPIVATVDPMEPALEPMVPFLSPGLVTSIIKNPPSPQLGFRFFIWASKYKRFRSWLFHTVILDMLIKDNGLELYWQVLNDIKKCDLSISAAAFTVLIQAYAKMGMVEKAVEAFERMKDVDCEPDIFTCNTILSVIVRKEVFLLALGIYNRMLKINCLPNSYTYSMLIDVLCKSGKTHNALQMLDEMTQRGISPNKVTYTIIISGLCQAQRTDDAYRLFNTMKDSGCRPDFVTYNALLDGFCKLGRVDEAMALLKFFKKDGYVLNKEGYSCLIDGLFRARKFEDAQLWYRQMIEDNIKVDVILYTIMMKGLLKAGKVKDALKLLSEMTERVWKGLVGDAQQMFNEMEKLGCYPSVITFNALIDGLCKAGKLEEAQLLFYKMEIGRNPSLFLRLSQGADRVLDTGGLQTMVEQLCVSGLILKAYKILMQLADSGFAPNINTYNILINGFCKAGNINGAFKLVKELQLKGLSPDSVTYGTLINGLLSIKREEDAFRVLDQMFKSGCTPTTAVYKSLMTWSCRRKKVSLAFNIWLQYLQNVSGRDNEVVKIIEEYFEKGEVEKAVRKLLEMDFKLNDFELAPYSIWLIGLCQAGRVEEALNIFFILQECKVVVTPPSCVKLIRGLCREGNLDLAVEMFLYTIEKGYILMPRICNLLLKLLLRSEDKRDHAFDLLSRMESLGYNLDAHLRPTTKFLLHSDTVHHRHEKDSGGSNVTFNRNPTYASSLAYENVLDMTACILEAISDESDYRVPLNKAVRILHHRLAVNFTSYELSFDWHTKNGLAYVNASVQRMSSANKTHLSVFWPHGNNPNFIIMPTEIVTCLFVEEFNHGKTNWKAGTVLSIILMTIVFAMFLLTRKGIRSESMNNSARVSKEFSRDLLIRKLPYHEIASAANNFSSERMLGQGGAGRVYQGYLCNSSRLVAVKRICLEHK